MEEQIVSTLFSPRVYLASTDPWFPVSVEWFLERSELCFLKGREKKIVDQHPKKFNLHTHTCQSNNIEYSSYGNSSKDRSKYFYLKIKSPDYYVGMSVEALRHHEIPVYVHYSKKGDYVDIQYFYFYAFNGNIVDQLQYAGIHEGDWEHTCVRLSVDILTMIPNNSTVLSDQWVSDHINELKSCISCIYYARHGREGKWYFQEASQNLLDDGYSLVDNSVHHIVYSAKGGHACYTTPNAKNRRYVPFGMPLHFIDDYTDNKGEIWETWNNVIILNSDDDDQNWLHFNGEWGKKPENFLAVAGPFGPLMKTYYFDGDTPPTELNSVYHDSVPHPCAPHVELWVNFGLRAFFCSIILLVIIAVLYFFSLVYVNHFSN